MKSRSRLVHLKTNARNKEESMRTGCERGARVHRPPPRAVVQFVHFKCTQRRGTEVAPALTKLTCLSQRRLTFIGQTRRNFRYKRFTVVLPRYPTPLPPVHCAVHGSRCACACPFQLCSSPFTPPKVDIDLIQSAICFVAFCS